MSFFCNISMLFLNLPAELQNEILKRLDGVSLARAEHVCKLWKKLLSSSLYNLIWRRECLSNIDESVLIEVTGIDNVEECEQMCSKTGAVDAKGSHVWKIIYQRWYITRKVGKWPFMEREIHAHNDEVCDVMFWGSILFTAGVDGCIKLWDSWSGVLIKSLPGHFYPVRSIALYPNPVNRLLTSEPCLPELLLSASEDSKICVWDVETGHCQSILCGHNRMVSSVAVYKDLGVSASFDETIKIWDLSKLPESFCVNTLKGHYSPITYLSLWKIKALSVSHNAIKLWSLETGECLQTLEHADSIPTYVTQGCALHENQAVLVKSNGVLMYCDFAKPSVSTAGDEVCRNRKLLSYGTTCGSHVSCLATYGHLMAIGTYAGVVYFFHFDKDWSEELTELHCMVSTNRQSLCCIDLSCDEDGPVLTAGFSDGVVKFYRWFSPSVD